MAGKKRGDRYVVYYPNQRNKSLEVRRIFMTRPAAMRLVTSLHKRGIFGVRMVPTARPDGRGHEPLDAHPSFRPGFTGQCPVCGSGDHKVHPRHPKPSHGYVYDEPGDAPTPEDAQLARARKARKRRPRARRGRLLRALSRVR